MANKKLSQVEQEPLEEQDEDPVFEAGDYYTALVKIKGTKELVKIRGKVIENNGWGNSDYSLLNNQGGEEADCDDDENGFSFEIPVSNNTQSGLDEAGVKEFTVVTDKRQ